MKKYLYPSMMCANITELRKEIYQLDQAGVDGYHLDVMDGSFVENFALGLGDIQSICKLTKKPCDVHLMIEHADRHLKTFANLGVSLIYVHSEADPHIAKTLQSIRDLNCKVGLAINPGTAFEIVKPLLELIDYALVMTVNPGFAGQKYLKFVDEKISQLVRESDHYNYKIVIDGACSPEIIKRLSRIGADGFVLGTSALFGKKKMPYKELIEYLRGL